MQAIKIYLVKCKMIKKNALRLTGGINLNLHEYLHLNNYILKDLRFDKNLRVLNKYYD